MSTLTKDQLHAYETVLNAVYNKTSDEVHIYEDLYAVDAHEAFEQVCENNIGISGLRLDLFIDSIPRQKEDTYELETKEEA